MKKFLLFCLIGIICTSCSNQKSQLKNILLNDEFWYYNAIYFPLHLSLYGELSKDTAYVMLTARNLFEDVNVKIIPYEKFPQLLYNEIKNNGGYINVNLNVFEWYKENAIIEKNNALDSIYNARGILGILDYAVDGCGRLTKHDKEGSYIMYLCFQHGIYFYNQYNDPWIYVNLKSIKDIK